jgi:hypothetical protein
MWEQLTVVHVVRPGLIPAPGLIPHNFGLMVHVDSPSGIPTLVDGAVLVVGGYPEGVPYQALNPAEDFQRCQRFYEVGVGTFAGSATTAIANADEMIFATEKHAIPTINFSISASINHNATIVFLQQATTHGMRRFLQPSVDGMVRVVASWTVDVP